MVPRTDEALDKGIQGIRGICGKTDMGRIACPEESANLPTDTGDHSLGLNGPIIASPTGRGAKLKILFQGLT